LQVYYATLCLLAAPLARAAVRMPAFFGDGMVMQTNAEYGARSFLNGMADPMENVLVKNGHTQYRTQADSAGVWSIQLLHPSGSITVSGENGADVTANDVASGDVFFCSGQSNSTNTSLFSFQPAKLTPASFFRSGVPHVAHAECHRRDRHRRRLP
jgi:hypothetical protein